MPTSGTTLASKVASATARILKRDTLGYGVWPAVAVNPAVAWGDVRVHVAHLGDDVIDAPARAFAELVEIAPHRRHVLAGSPADADLILFTQAHMLVDDWRLDTLRRHPLTRQYRSKVYVYDERDRPWCAFPGVYVSMPRRSFIRTHQRAWGYYTGDASPVEGEPDLLFSFVGSATARCRRPLFALRHPDGVVERVDKFTFFDPSSRDFDARRANFRGLLGRSRFVLCPRGRGTSSIRLYETLAAGRVPVIIADDWVPPDGPEWESFSIRWPEHRTRGLVQTLIERSADWTRLGAKARAAYDAYFSSEVCASNILDAIEELRKASVRGQMPERGVRNAAFARAALYAHRSRIEPELRRSVTRLVRAAWPPVNR